MTAAKKLNLVSVEEYLAGELASDVRHEYVGGCVYAMAGAKNVHNAVVTTLQGLLFAALRGNRCQPFNSDTKVRIRMPTQTRFYYPDVMVVCDANSPEDSFQDQPVLIAEVISESTRRTDEGEKLDAYMSVASLNTYLVVETDQPRIVVHRRTPRGFEAELYEGLDAVIPITDLEIDLPLAEVYERVEFS
jgi:Uma2 family endonuclease